MLPLFLRRSTTRTDYGTEDLRTGLTLDLWFRIDSLESGQLLVDTRLPSGQSLCLRTTEKRTIEIVLNDGRTGNRWDTDPESSWPGSCNTLPR